MLLLCQVMSDRLCQKCLSDKDGKVLFCPAENFSLSDKCPVTLQKILHYTVLLFCSLLLFRCLKCCFWCLEKFLRFLNRNAYIMVSRFCENFCCKKTHEKLAVIILKFEQSGFTIELDLCPKEVDRMANNVDPDQTAPSWAVWSATTLFWPICRNLGSL